jgi:hypothetical protein
LVGIATLASLLSLRMARADEIKLKDGSKIIGTIVGFEDNSFKVKTSYGFAVVQKDQVVSITVTDSAKKPEPVAAAKTPVAASVPASAPAPAPTTAPTNPHSTSSSTTPSNARTTAPLPAKSEKAPPVSASAPQTSASTPQTSSAESDDNSTVTYPHTDTVVAPAKDAARNTADAQPAQTPPAVAPPPKPVAPLPVREEVSGNLYTNETFGFHMYKPPDWKVIEGARTILPGAITALGTDDQTTYLIIGQETTGKSLASDMSATEQRLHEMMDNYRPLGEKTVMISGVSAIEHRFRGNVDQRDWSCLVVYIPRGTTVYTIFGMTLADTDLVQIQENVISRAIHSLQFIKQ